MRPSFVEYIIFNFGSILFACAQESVRNTVFVNNGFGTDNGPPITCLGTISLAVGAITDHPTDWPIKLDQARIYVQNMIGQCLANEEEMSSRGHKEEKQQEEIREWLMAKRRCPDMLNNGHEPSCATLKREAFTVIQQLTNVTRENLQHLVAIRSQKLVEFLAACSAHAKETDVRDFILYLRGIQQKCNPSGTAASSRRAISMFNQILFVLASAILVKIITIAN